ncbi:MAG TPA: NlpC/P60 family protein [Isosphaeraceae bacterium]|nr:NlpC/P60 family protein [Isosphaeraceae bacterium]
MGVAKQTHLNPRTIAAQARAEEGSGAQTEAEQTHNFLNMGPGISYPSLQAGIHETAKNYNTNPLYAGVRATRGQGPKAQAQAIASSPWGTGPLIEQTLSQVGLTPGNPKAQARYQALAKEAKSLGMKVGKPTPGTSSSGHTVYVRADAKGALQFARANIGVTTGSAKEVAFATQVGGATDPWCATFASAVLKRMGIQPPANPSYSGAFAENWKGGSVLPSTNIASAKPGDLLIFDWGDGGMTDHVAFYAGKGKMIGGNQGAGEVSEDEVPAGNIVSIVRPHYRGGKVALKESAPVPSGFTPSGGVTEAPAATGLVASPTPVPKGAGKDQGHGKPPVKLSPAQIVARVESKLNAATLAGGKEAEAPSTAVLDALERKYGG